MRHALGSLLLLSGTVAVAALAGCGNGASGGTNDVAPQDPTREPVIEEPDLYRVDGRTLYVQNPDTGLNLIDVGDAAKPRLLGAAPLTGGSGAELYVQPGEIVVVMLKTATPSCTPIVQGGGVWKVDAEVALVDAKDKSRPKVLGRHCLPGTLVASRTIDRILYAVVTDPNATFNKTGSRAYAIDLADPTRPRVIAEAEFSGASKEIQVTANSILVAARTQRGGSTRVQYLSIDGRGAIVSRGAVEIPGEPQGRFHMDLRGTQFRIVTFEGASSRLSVIDFTNPDSPRLIGGLGGLGRNERLYATRFDGDKAYIVTFRRTDPLWVVSLADPARPELVGELQVPGWSDFLFPRGDRLLAVGRGNNGFRVGVSLFDVSNPSHPRVVEQREFGDQGAQSEANTDHRGVTILESVGGNPLLIVPYGTVRWSKDDAARTVCTVTDVLQLIEVQPSRLLVRGAATQKGSVRRSFPVGTSLYGLSDYEVQAIDISNRDQPRSLATLALGTAEGLRRDVKETCEASRRAIGHVGCTVAARDPAAGLPAVALIGLALFASRRRRGA